MLGQISMSVKSSFFVNVEADIDECEDYPCINGNCINTIGAFTCSCDVGFLGILCEIGEITSACLLYEGPFSVLP